MSSTMTSNMNIIATVTAIGSRSSEVVNCELKFQVTISNSVIDITLPLFMFNKTSNSAVYYEYADEEYDLMINDYYSLIDCSEEDIINKARILASNKDAIMNSTSSMKIAGNYTLPMAIIVQSLDTALSFCTRF